jgi:predicted nucleic-acid-binding protein
MLIVEKSYRIWIHIYALLVYLTVLKHSKMKTNITASQVINHIIKNIERWLINRANKQLHEIMDATKTNVAIQKQLINV